MKLQIKETDSRKTVQLLFLLAGGGTVFFFMIFDAVFPGMGYFVGERFLTVPGLLFFGSALTQKLSNSAKGGLWMAALAVLWFFVVQMQHHLSGMGIRTFSYFAIVYLLAFPYAAVTEDEKSIGLKWIGKIYVASSLLLIIFAGMLLLDLVPEVLAAEIYWDGARLNAIWHPNTGACIMMIGIGFSLYFFFLASKRWERVLYVAMVAVLFCGLILTNSRTSILLTCALIGGTFFITMVNGAWKRFLVGGVAIAIVIVALFSIYRVVFDFHTKEQTEKLMSMEAGENKGQMLKVNEETGEVHLTGLGAQGSLSEDMWTLNGRTYIWKAAFQVLEDTPTFKIWGTEYVAEEISYRNNFPVAHAHNSWIQVMLHLGIPGLLVALVYTVVAVWNSLILLWRKEAEKPQKMIALLVLCILMASFLENYLFIGDLSTLFVNFVFFLCTGYLAFWRRALPEKMAATKI